MFNGKIFDNAHPIYQAISAVNNANKKIYL